ncbi:MAG: CoA transferase [Burkholderiaceae bacterium]
MTSHERSGQRFLAQQARDHNEQPGLLGACLTADGITTISPIRDAHFQALCKVLQRPDLTADPRYRSAPARLGPVVSSAWAIEIRSLYRCPREPLQFESKAYRTISPA